MCSFKTCIYILSGLYLLLNACGPSDTNSALGHNGAYSTTLVFPDDIPRKPSGAKNLTGIDCAEAGIATITFIFTQNGAELTIPRRFSCNQGSAVMKDIPPGLNIRVDAYAENSVQNVLLKGYEFTDIHSGKVTPNGVIEMQYSQFEDQDGDGYSEDIDCNDNDSQVHPGATEIALNAKDDDCDGEGLGTFPPDDRAYFTTQFDMTFALIKADSFTMGSPVGERGQGTDETAHEVILTRDYYIQTTEVTYEQWREVVNTAGDTGLEADPGNDCIYDYGCPKGGVSWNHIQIFIQALNKLSGNRYRFDLPTEAQWEYAARGGSRDAFANGGITLYENMWDCNPDPTLDVIGWYCANSGPSPYDVHPVATKEMNAFGLYDMHGSVYEWCKDGYAEYLEGPIEDPEGAPGTQIEHVLRGGSYATPAVNCRSAYRFSEDPSRGFANFGFRLVATPASE